jgi:hypothetical protein
MNTFTLKLKASCWRKYACMLKKRLKGKQWYNNPHLLNVSSKTDRTCLIHTAFPEPNATKICCSVGTTTLVLNEWMNEWVKLMSQWVTVDGQTDEGGNK